MTSSQQKQLFCSVILTRHFGSESVPRNTTPHGMHVAWPNLCVVLSGAVLAFMNPCSFLKRKKVLIEIKDYIFGF